MEKKREDGVIVRETRNLVNDLSYRFADAGDVLLEKEVKALKGVHRGLSVFWSVPMLVVFGMLSFGLYLIFAYSLKWLCGKGDKYLDSNLETARRNVERAG